MSRKRAAVGPLLPPDMDAKHASLMQDYLQLQDDFDALGDRVEAAKIRKRTLLAEVRFLRRRLKKLKGAASDSREKETASVVVRCDFSTAYSGKSASGAVVPEASSQSPNNKLPPTTEIPLLWGPFRTSGSYESAKPKPLNENVELVSALKTSAFRNRPNMFVAAITGKRKISWKDQISLECN